MMQTVSDSTLSFLFEETPAQDDNLSDPFLDDEEELAKNIVVAVPESSADAATDQDTYTFRWDVELPLAERGKCGAKFMKQWKRVLQVQRLTPLVSAKLPPHEARFQLCVAPAAIEMARVHEQEAEIAEQLSHLRRDALPIVGEPAGTHPAGWQGVRVWMTFARREVETALSKKSKI